MRNITECCSRTSLLNDASRLASAAGSGLFFALNVGAGAPFNTSVPFVLNYFVVLWSVQRQMQQIVDFQSNVGEGGGKEWVLLPYDKLASWPSPQHLPHSQCFGLSRTSDTDLPTVSPYDRYGTSGLSYHKENENLDLILRSSGCCVWYRGVHGVSQEGSGLSDPKHQPPVTLLIHHPPCMARVRPCESFYFFFGLNVIVNTVC